MVTPNYPYSWYSVVGDTNPTTQVWEWANGLMVANSSANYQSWVANGGQSSAFAKQHFVLGAAAGTAGVVRLTLDQTTAMVTNDVWVVQNVGGTTEANGTFAITLVDSTHIELQGTTFVHAWTSGGVVDRGNFQSTMAGLLATIDSVNQGRESQRQTYLPVSSGVNYTLANLPPLLFDFTPTANGLIVTLPQMNVPGSVGIGRPIILHNSGSSSFQINRFDGTALTSLQPFGFFILYLSNNSTQSGVFVDYFVQATSHQSLGNSNGSFNFNSNALVTVLATSAAFTAPRTWTLPPANFGNGTFPGIFVLVVDEVGGVTATNTLSVARAGADTINGGAGSVVLNRARDFVLLETDGVSNWTVVGGHGSLASTDLSDLPIPVSSGGTGLASLVTGTYTPTITAGSGTFTTVSATGRFIQIGKLVFVGISITDTTNGTAAGFVIATLPVAPLTSNLWKLPGTDNVAAATCMGNVSTASGGTVNIFKYDGSYPLGSGVGLAVAGWYEAA